MAKKKSNGTTRGLAGGYHLCFECTKSKPVSCFELMRVKVKKGVHFADQVCDDCIYKARARVKQQIIDCRVEENFVVKTLEGSNLGEPYDRYSAMLHDGHRF